MVQMSPSILSADFAKLGAAVADSVAAGAGYIHLDVMDGNFVPNITFGAPIIAALAPYKGKARFDTHLMINDPARYIADFARAGSDIITVHVEAGGDIAAALRAVRGAGCLAGVSVKPGTLVSAAEPYRGLFDLFLVMSVEPGFGGQAFIPAALDKIREAKRLFPGVMVSVDGGINSATAPSVIASGADIMVAGSAVYGAPSIEQGIKALLRQSL